MEATRLLVAVTAIVILACNTTARPPSVNRDELVAETGGYSKCINGKLHNVVYNTTRLGSSHIYDMDAFHGLKKISCDIDHTQLHLEFHNIIDSTEIAAKLLHEEVFVVGGAKWGCQQKNRTANVVRRVITDSYEGTVLKLKTTLARYDEIYETADIQYNTAGSCEETEESTHHVCIGFNTDCKSNQAEQPLPLYTNQFLTVTCANCFYGWEADIFFHVKISDWTVSYIGAGYKNAIVRSNFEVDVEAQPQWSAGIDKTEMFLPETPIVDFDVGIVPFVIAFEIPVEFVANINLMTDAKASFGASANWTIGDHYAEFTPSAGWTHVKPHPVESYSTVLTAIASVDASAVFAIKPKFIMHVDRILTYTVSLDPEINADLHYDTTSKQVCETATYDVNLAAAVELDINIPFANINDDWIWNHEIWDSGVHNLTSKCITP